MKELDMVDILKHFRLHNLLTSNAIKKKYLPLTDMFDQYCIHPASHQKPSLATDSDSTQSKEELEMSKQMKEVDVATRDFKEDDREQFEEWIV